MIFFFDTSALIKRYITENGSDVVEQLMSQASTIFLSPITFIECNSILKRLLIEKYINNSQYLHIKSEIEEDFKYFTVISFSKSIETNACNVIEKYNVKTLDSIQLGSLIEVKEKIQSFVVCDNILIASALSEGINVINPLSYK